jgi:chemotaxis protein CheD
MNKPLGGNEIFLQPGEFYFGDAATRIRTLLGSCVAITLWHPARMIGGMCHYMLPNRQKSGGPLDGKYADEAMALFLLEVAHHHTRPEDYQVKLFGGGTMFAGYSEETSVAQSNINAARQLVTRHHLQLSAEDLGRNGHRDVIFDISSGHVWVRHQDLNES